MAEPKKDVQKQPENAQEYPKKPYTTPHLTVHGDVEKLTGALGNGPKDALTGSALL